MLSKDHNCITSITMTNAVELVDWVTVVASPNRL